MALIIYRIFDRFSLPSFFKRKHLKDTNNKNNNNRLKRNSQQQRLFGNRNKFIRYATIMALKLDHNCQPNHKQIFNASHKFKPKLEKSTCIAKMYCGKRKENQLKKPSMCPKLVCHKLKTY